MRAFLPVHAGDERQTAQREEHQKRPQPEPAVVARARRIGRLVRPLPLRGEGMEPKHMSPISYLHGNPYKPAKAHEYWIS